MVDVRLFDASDRASSPQHQRDALALTGRSALTAQPAETQEMVRIGASARGMTSEAFWASMVGTNPELVAGSAAGRLS